MHLNLRWKKFVWQVYILYHCPKTSESKLQRGYRRGGRRLAVSGIRPAILVDLTNAHWHRGHSNTPPQPGGQPAARVSTQRDPRSSAVVLHPKLSAHTCSTSLGCYWIHCKTTYPVRSTIKTWMLALDEVPQHTAHQASYLFLAFQSLPTMYLFQPSPLGDNTMFWFVSF